MIRLRDVHYRYPSSPWVLRGIDLSIEQGEYVFVCGASGSGKSTLAYLLNGLIPHFFGGTLNGSAWVNGANTREKGVSELFPRVGLVLQNTDAQLFNSTVENEIAFGLESLGFPGPEIGKRIDKISRALGIEALLDRSPMNLSGGEKRLVAIASVLCLNPSVLVLDEPYAHLDWEGTRRVRQLLKEIHKSGRTLVVIEQRVGGFLLDATRCLVLKQGKVIFDGAPREAHKTILNEHLIPQYPPRKRNRPGPKEPLLTVQDLTCRIGEREILHGVSFELHRRETTAIIGRNGAGKSTLIRHLNGLLRPAHGKVNFMGHDVQRILPLAMATSVGVCFQNPNDQFFKNRVQEEILVGSRRLGKAAEAWIQEIYELFALHHLLDRSPYQLSEGEKKRVALASVLSMKPELFVIDEPTVGQDGHFREVLAALIARLEQRGQTVLIVSHDLDFARATADRWIVLHEGRVLADGPPQDLLRDKGLAPLSRNREGGVLETS